MSIPDISALKGSFTHLFCCLPWGQQDTVETFLHSPEQPHGGILCLGLLREGFQFLPPSPDGSDTGQPGLLFPHWWPSQHNCSFTSDALGLGGGGMSECQFSQPSSINHVLNDQRLVVCYGCVTRDRSWRPFLERASRMSPV